MSTFIMMSNNTFPSLNSPPKRYFFNANKGISPKQINNLVNKYGNNILIGVDPGENDTPSDVAKPSLDCLKNLKIPAHIYCVGPGMMSWSQQERNQIKRYAKSVGIDISKNDWHKEWLAHGWEKKTLQQFKWYNDNYNAYSMEIDNLDAVFEKKQDALIPWFIQLKKNLRNANVKTKLMLKNLSDDQLHDLIDANADLNLEFLCGFAMFEKGTGNPRTQIKLCESIGIQAITPINGLNDTQNYGVVDSGVVYNCNT